jgi:hypothetical protein
MTRFGEVEIAHSHSCSVKGSRNISPYLQELMVYAGATEIYGEAAELIEKFLEIPISRTQVYRLSNEYGSALQAEVYSTAVDVPEGDEEVIYAEIDGSMIATDDGWKEVKVGRIFRSSDLRAAPVESEDAGRQQRGGQILSSSYLAHLGTAMEFTTKFAVLLTAASGLGSRLVFINDGAEWIWLWVGRMYPEATQILDFYHVVEHLGEFAALAINDATERSRWYAEQKALLLAGRVARVINNLEKYRALGGEVKERADKLQRYYRANHQRMCYDEYIRRGLAIGSGAIESTHRTLVQSRLKLSGQYWSIAGAQNVLNLRSLQMSGNWHRVLNKINATVRGTSPDLN